MNGAYIQQRAFFWGERLAMAMVEMRAENMIGARALGKAGEGYLLAEHSACSVI